MAGLVPANHVFVLRGTNKVDGRHTGESQRFPARSRRPDDKLRGAALRTAMRGQDESIKSHRDLDFWWRMIFSESRHPFFRRALG
jgi:hypothetical protein